MEIFLDTALDALLDTLKLLPFLIIIYILIELLEHKTTLAKENSRLSGRLGVLIGAATGLVPQCGFSVMAAKLYDRGFIAVGTLIAVFISTSDEAFVILLSSGEGALFLLPLIIIKILVGVIVGYAVNAAAELWRKRRPAEVFAGVSLNGEEGKADYHARVFAVKTEEECTSCGRSHDEKHPAITYFVNPLLHSLKIALYVYIVTFAFGLLIGYIGKDAVMDFLNQNVYLQPLITALIGLIPNCASSVVITQSFLVGGISFGSLTAGLCANAGLGFVVLLKDTKKWKRNLVLLVGLYVLSVLVGLGLNGIEAAVRAAGLIA